MLSSRTNRSILDKPTYQQLLSFIWTAKQAATCKRNDTSTGGTTSDTRADNRRQSIRSVHPSSRQAHEPRRECPAPQQQQLRQDCAKPLAAVAGAAAALPAAEHVLAARSVSTGASYASGQPLQPLQPLQVSPAASPAPAAAQRGSLASGRRVAGRAGTFCAEYRRQGGVNFIFTPEHRR